ncbi:MAG: hypothetical protein Q3965_01275 [Rothia sp. (in: high G+C Gram-positive bacteria)]|nr:hypothetical protein [Rothia sp. (in: high G+C Gram-positive bacteria)]
MFTIVDLVLYAIIAALLALLFVAFASDGWKKLEKKSQQALHRDLALGLGS